MQSYSVRELNEDHNVFILFYCFAHRSKAKISGARYHFPNSFLLREAWRKILDRFHDSEVSYLRDTTWISNWQMQRVVGARMYSQDVRFFHNKLGFMPFSTLQLLYLILHSHLAGSLSGSLRVHDGIRRARGRSIIPYVHNSHCKSVENFRDFLVSSVHSCRTLW